MNVNNPVTFLLSIVHSTFLFSLTLRNTSSFFTRSFQIIFSSRTFQNFQGISDLLFEVSVFDQHKNLCYKRAINQYVIRLLVPSTCTATQKAVILYLTSTVYTLIESENLFPFQKNKLSYPRTCPFKTNIILLKFSYRSVIWYIKK
jgi:hypothetical protein